MDDVRPTFPEVLEGFYRDKHTGPVTVHFAQGVPNVVEIPEEPMRIRLDKREPLRASLTR
jgi:hypothetical protein